MPVQTITFYEVPEYSLQADIYRAEGASMGTILYVHGGGLIWGSRKELPAWQAELYTQAGFDLVGIDYRLAPETKLPGIIEDVRAGLEWVRDHGAEHGLNTANIFVVGSSAGGYLSLMTGTFPYRPKAIVSFYGYGDIVADWYTEPSGHYLGKPLVSREEAYCLVGNKPISEGPQARFLIYLYCRQYGMWPVEISNAPFPRIRQELRSYCPLHLADGNYPPTFLLHGDRDDDVPHEQSEQMHARLQELGVESRLQIVQGKGHIFDYPQADPVAQEALANVVSFLKSHCE